MSNKLKYVRLEDNDEIIIFPMMIEHKTFKLLNPISAGFCYINQNEVKCFGKSLSLDIKSIKDEDTLLATKQVFGDDAMLNLKTKEKIE